jgi:serine-type D-Ala-D-Ala carboxypeptidase/endopeptidase (penicillin-binding protein 4)
VARVRMEPPLAGVTLPPTVPLTPQGNACGDWRTALGAAFEPTRFQFTGAFPAACGEMSWALAYPDPRNFAARAIAGLWGEMGGEVGGVVREGRVPAGLTPAFEAQSPALAEVIRDINKFSNNVMTQQLFLTMGAASGSPGNPARGAAAVRGLLSARGIDVPELVLENGCGLSRVERISAGSLANVLGDAWKSQWMPELMASLPVSGVDGTMKGRNVPVGAAHMKTGLLEDTRAVAGYVLAASGRRYVVVGIINHPNARYGTGAHDALIDWVFKTG